MKNTIYNRDSLAKLEPRSTRQILKNRKTYRVNAYGSVVVGVRDGKHPANLKGRRRARSMNILDQFFVRC